MTKTIGKLKSKIYFFLGCYIILYSFLLPIVFAENGAVIKIGWSGPLSGNSAVLGVDSLEATRIVVDRVNKEGGIRGRKIELIIEDDQYDTTKAVNAYSKLALQDKCEIIISNTYGGVFATAERAKKDGIVIVNPLDCNEEIAKLADHTFCIATQSESVGVAIADRILKMEKHKTAVLFDQQNPFMVVVEKIISDRLSQSSQPIIFSVPLSSGEQDFRTDLIKAKQKGVDSLIFLGHDSMGLAMKQARQLGVNAQFFSVGTITSSGFQELAGDAADGTLVAYWEAPKSKQYDEFIKAFKASTSRVPILELATIPSYDATSLVVLALNESILEDRSLDKKKILEQLYSIKNYQGLSGTISMDKDGAVRSIKERIFKFSNKKLIELN